MIPCQAYIFRRQCDSAACWLSYDYFHISGSACYSLSASSRKISVGAISKLCVCIQWLPCPMSHHQTVNKSVSRKQSRFCCVICCLPSLLPSPPFFLHSFIAFFPIISLPSLFSLFCSFVSPIRPRRCWFMQRHLIHISKHNTFTDLRPRSCF